MGVAEYVERCRHQGANGSEAALVANFRLSACTGRQADSQGGGLNVWRGPLAASMVR